VEHPASSLAGVTDIEGRLEVQVEEGDPPVVVLVGEVDPHTAPDLDQVLSRLLDEGHRTLRVDCAALGFIDSSGLRVLVDAHRRLDAAPGALVLTHASPTLRRLLEVTGLDQHFLVED
jgi:anti-sigma B factor antagonist